MDHDAGAETCFIGKHAPLHAPGHSRLYPAAHNAATDGLHSKGTLEDGSESRQDAPVIHSNDGQCSNDIQQRHNRYQLFRDCRNALQASHDDQSCNGHQKHTRDPVGNGENRPHVGGNGIDLSHIANAEAGENAEYTEQQPQDFAQLLTAPEAAQAVPQIVHGPAGPLPCGILPAVVDAQNVLGEVRHHAENGHDPHPENGPGTACSNGRSNACDVACTDGGGQSGAKALELADRPVLLGSMGRYVLVFENGANGMRHPEPEMAQLKALGQNRHQNAGAHQQHQHGQAPDKVVDLSVDHGYNIPQSVHKMYPPFSQKTGIPAKGYSCQKFRYTAQEAQLK